MHLNPYEVHSASTEANTSPSGPRNRRGRSRAVSLLSVVGLAAAAAATVAVTDTSAGAAISSNGGSYAYMLNINAFTPGNNVPPSQNRYNSKGATDDGIIHSGTGSYAVYFHNMVKDGTAHVTAFGSGTCKIPDMDFTTTSAQYPDDNLVRVDVQCFNNAGARQDMLFDVVYSATRGLATTAPSAKFGYLNASSYSSSQEQFNSAGALNTSVRVSTGRYKVTFPQLAVSSSYPTGTVQITARDYTANRCSSGGFDSNRAPADIAVYVTCYTPAGVAVNTDFNITYANDVSLIGSATNGAYVWVMPKTTNGSQTPYWPYTFNASGTANQIYRKGQGYYEVVMYGIPNGGTFQAVTTVGGGHECHIGGISGTSPTAYVLCTDAAGQPADVAFSVKYAK